MGIEDEILIEVEELPNYLISNKGNIFSKKKKLFKKFFIVNNYYRVQVIKDKERKSISRSQIVYKFYNNDYRLFQGHLRGVIHHKNTNTLDDDIDNLKLITNRENCSIEKTLKSGLPVGVVFQNNKYKSRITLNKIFYNLGTFNSMKEAEDKYKEALNNYESNNILPISYKKSKAVSKEKGITFCKISKKWLFRVTINKIRVCIGKANTEKEILEIKNKYLSQ